MFDLSFKLYVRPHLDYGDVIYHGQRTDLMKLVEEVQYKAMLIVSGCWKGTNKIHLYDELGCESLSDRRSARRLTIFHKIRNGQAPSYLSEHIPEQVISNIYSRNTNIRAPARRTGRYAHSFFPYCISEWNNLDASVKNLPSISSFKKHLNIFIRSKGCSTYEISDTVGMSLLSKIRVQFSDLGDHRFNHYLNCWSAVFSWFR